MAFLLEFFTFTAVLQRRQNNANIYCASEIVYDLFILMFLHDNPPVINCLVVICSVTMTDECSIITLYSQYWI